MEEKHAGIKHDYKKNMVCGQKNFSLISYVGAIGSRTKRIWYVAPPFTGGEKHAGIKPATTKEYGICIK